MATPAKKIDSIQLPNDSDKYTIVPIMVTDSTKTYKATIPTLTKDSTILLNQSYTTKGDILYASSAETPTRLGIGTSGQVLTVVDGVPAWANASSGTVTDVQVNGTSIVASGVANFNTISAYDASDNKVATDLDLPKVYRFI